MPATNPDPRTTDDKFVMELTTEDNHQSVEEIETMLRGTDIYELSVKAY